MADTAKIIRALKTFKGFAVFLGGEARVWRGSTLAFDHAADVVRGAFTESFITWATGVDLFGKLVMKGGTGGWHASATDENKQAI